MSYPWFVFTVWFADGYDGVYSATGVSIMDAVKELMSGFEDDADMREDIHTHGDILKLQFEPGLSQETDAAQRVFDMASAMQTDINRILKKEDLYE